MQSLQSISSSEKCKQILQSQGNSWKKIKTIQTIGIMRSKAPQPVINTEKLKYINIIYYIDEL
jgi:hypothetical protein